MTLNHYPEPGDYVFFGKRHKSLAILEWVDTRNYKYAKILWLKSGRRQKVRYSSLRTPTALEMLAAQGRAQK